MCLHGRRRLCAPAACLRRDWPPWAHTISTALAYLLAVAAGVGLCCVATWIAQVSAQVERMRLLDVTGFVASLAVLGIAAYVFVQHPANGGPAAGALS